MSFIKTLAKVAIGVAIAKGVSHISKNGLPRADTPGAGRGTTYSGNDAGSNTGLGGIMDEITGGGAATRRAAPSTQTGGGFGGGLGGLLDELTKTKSGTTKTTRKNAPSGFDDLLGSLTKSTGAARGASSGGGLGDLLGGILGGAAAGGGIGGLGNMFDQAAAGREPEQPNRDQELAAALMLKAMIQAAKSDGKLDQDEKKKLMDNMGDATQDEIAFVNNMLSEPVDIEGLVRQVPEGMEQQVYLMSLMAIDLDSKNEAQYLHDLAQGLGLEPPAVNAIHDHANAPHIYR